MDIRVGHTELSVLLQKVKLCDDGHIAFAQSSLVLQTEGKGAAMRRALPIVIVAVPLTATIDINVAVPNGMKSFPTELLPQ
jgi:hypothetical protein